MLANANQKDHAALIERLKYISPVAWQHINLYGYYTFEGEQAELIDLVKIAEEIDLM